MRTTRRGLHAGGSVSGAAARLEADPLEALVRDGNVEVRSSVTTPGIIAETV